MSGFPCGATARYEDQASTSPVNFSVTWEKRNRPGGVLSLFFRAKLSYILLTFTLTSSVMAVKLRKSVRSASSLTTQPRPFSPLQRRKLGIFQLSPGCFSMFSQLSTPCPPVPFHWVGNSLGIFQSVPHPVSFDWVGISQYLSTEPHSV